jgi:hypothetical protein
VKSSPSQAVIAYAKKYGNGMDIDKLIKIGLEALP